MSAQMPWSMLIVFLLLAPSPMAPPEAPVEIAPNTFLIRPTPSPGRGPDGNTIIIDAPDGLIVVDTGRHTSQSDAILKLRRSGNGRSPWSSTRTGISITPAATAG